MTKELIARLEKATGPDRGLADEILLTCDWKIEEHGAGPDPSCVWIDPDPDGEDYIAGDQPDPTASLDAALALLTDDQYLIALRQVNPKWWSAEIGCKHDDHKSWDADAPTGPNALTAASLKARSA